MKNFDWTQFSKKMAIKANVEEIYNAWTIPEEIERWFLSSTRYFDTKGNLADRTSPIKSNFTYEWHWHLYDGEEKGEIIDENGKDHLQFTFAGDCKVDVKLNQQDEYTIVTLIQTNIPTDDDSKKNIRLGCDSGWAFYLVNLKSIYEGGLDLRIKDPKLKELLIC